ncbi:MAG: c-type cytochrome, partial [Planctomycetes bacterium]|nr:c-type cytochrome [Planctomycetota bacterium]
FLARAAGDPRWTADVMMPEIEQAIALSWLDRAIYRYLLIPLTKKAILEQDESFAWMNRPGWPDWGPGRTDPMNLTKYFMTDVPLDDSVGMADSPPLWNLRVRDGDGMALQWDGSTPSSRSVVIDSALGLGADPAPPFVEHAEALHAWLSTLPAPPWPANAPPIDGAAAARGAQIYARECASCHDVGSAGMGRVMPIAEIGTDPHRLNSWTAAAADQANAAVEAVGVKRVHMVKTEGYVPPPLDGLWARAPYLHNGSVPTLRDLLRPPGERPVTFWRGCDLFDPVDVGFVHDGAEAERVGHLLDTRVRGNGNGGHEYGTGLSAADKADLIEHLKRL